MNNLLVFVKPQNLQYLKNCICYEKRKYVIEVSINNAHGVFTNNEKFSTLNDI